MDQHATDEAEDAGCHEDGNGNYEITYRGLMLPALVLENAAPVPDVLVRGQGIRRPWDI